MSIVGPIHSLPILGRAVPDSFRTQEHVEQLAYENALKQHEDLEEQLYRELYEMLREKKP